MLEQFEFKLEKNIIAIQKDAGKNREVLSKQRKKRASLVTFDHGKLNITTYNQYTYESGKRNMMKRKQFCRASRASIVK